MRYLAIFALIFTACGEYDGNDFSEAEVCFEDGTEGRVSEVETPEKNADSPLGSADQHPAFDPDKARLPCIVTVWVDLRSGCYYYECENCTREDLLRNPMLMFCGDWFCPPYANGWVNPGYPIPFGAENVR